MISNFTSEVCSSSQCSYEIDFTQNITSDVIVEFYADGNLISTNIIGMSELFIGSSRDQELQYAYCKMW